MTLGLAILAFGSAYYLGECVAEYKIVKDAAKKSGLIH